MTAPLHLIAGWACHPSSLSPLADALANVATVTVHPFDVDLSQLRAINGPWTLAGWSLGGLRALDALARGELRPARLILIGSTARFCADADYPHGVARSSLRAMMIGLKRKRAETLERFFIDVAAPGHSGDVATRMREASFWSDDTLAAGLQWLDQLDARPALPNLRLPVLLLHGRHDAIIPAGASAYLHQRLPNARLVAHEHAGHNLPVIDPAWVAARIAAFCR